MRRGACVETGYYDPPDDTPQKYDYRVTCEDCGWDSDWLTGNEDESPEDLPEVCEECGNSELSEETRDHDSYDDWNGPD